MINTQIQYSEQNEAVWLFRFLPIKYPGEIIFSGLMFTIIGFLLPLTIITNTMALIIWPTTILHNIVLSWALSVVLLAFLILISDKYLPLSRLRSMRNSSQNMTIVFLNIFLILIIGGVAFGCTFLPVWVVYIIAGTLFFIFILLTLKIRKIEWKKIM